MLVHGSAMAQLITRLNQVKSFFFNIYRFKIANEVKLTGYNKKRTQFQQV